jgi:hypothetical protein
MAAPGDLAAGDGSVQQAMDDPGHEAWAVGGHADGSAQPGEAAQFTDHGWDVSCEAELCVAMDIEATVQYQGMLRVGPGHAGRMPSMTSAIAVAAPPRRG